MSGPTSADPPRTTVEVRRPLHRPSPFRRLADRWRARSERRRAEREARRADGEKVRWWEFLDLPFGDLGPVGGVLFAIVALVLLVLLVMFVGPIVWILLLFLIEALVWVVLALAGVAGWLLLGRPWQVVVLAADGSVLGSTAVRGRRAARRRATVIEGRLAGGADPVAAVNTP